MLLSVTLDETTASLSLLTVTADSFYPWCALTLRGALATAQLRRLAFALTTRTPLLLRAWRSVDATCCTVLPTIVRSYEVAAWEHPAQRTLAIELAVTGPITDCAMPPPRPAVPHTAH
jgi:hypothetical protein